MKSNHPKPEQTMAIFQEGRLTEISTFTFDGLAVTLTDEPAYARSACEVMRGLGLIDERDGQSSWDIEIEVRSPSIHDLGDHEVTTLGVNISRATRRAALSCAQAACRLLSGKAPLTGAWDATIINAGDAELEMPWILVAYGTIPEIGDVMVTASSTTLEAAWTTLTQLCPRSRLR